MSWKSDVVNKAVDRWFAESTPMRAARSLVLNTIGAGVLVTAATALSGPLSWLIWGWALWRLWTISLAGVLLDESMAERSRRLNGLPPQWLEFLRTGKFSAGTFRITEGSEWLQ